MLARRLSPYLDLAIGLAAQRCPWRRCSAPTSPASTRGSSPPTRFGGRHAVAGLSLVWRRTRPVAAFAVFVRLPRGHPDRPLHRPAVGAAAVQPLLAGGARPSAGRRGRAGPVPARLRRPRPARRPRPGHVRPRCRPAPCWSPRGRSATRSARDARSRRSGCGRRAGGGRGPGAGARAVTEERLRIARELHDVVAHSMSLIAVQAGVGGHVIRTDVAAAERALEVIAETSRRALTQTRSMLGLLRDEDADPASRPLQTIDDLDDLVARRARGRDRGLPDRQRCRRARSTPRVELHRLPHRPGVADQRAQALRREAGAGDGDLRRGRGRRRGQRPRSRRVTGSGEASVSRAGTGSSACASAPGCWAAPSTTARSTGRVPGGAHLPSPMAVAP